MPLQNTEQDEKKFLCFSNSLQVQVVRPSETAFLKRRTSYFKAVVHVNLVEYYHIRPGYGDGLHLRLRQVPVSFVQAAVVSLVETKIKWTQEEDAMPTEAVQRHGRSWLPIAVLIPVERVDSVVQGGCDNWIQAIVTRENGRGTKKT
jgi:hypothetical protein